MPDLNLEVCRAIAVQYGLPLQFVVKEFHVFEVLGQVTALAVPSRGFVFKGGTALNKVYLGGLQRFSEDLDFDLDAGSRAELRGFCKSLSERITGYMISGFRQVKDTVQFYCAYESPFGGMDHVRVDVALKKVIAQNPLALRPAVSFYTQRSVAGFYVYSLEDLVARKMCALMVRCEGKDVYDVYNALPLCGRLQGAIGKMLESEGSRLSPEEFLGRTVKAVRKSDPRKLRNLTNPFIPSGSRPKDWLELKNDLILRLERMLQ